MQKTIHIPDDVYKAKSETGQTLEEFLDLVDNEDVLGA